jgi:Uncharacterized conserved protein (small basic protein)
VAALLTYIGDRLGVDIYLAVVFALGYRMFQNVGRMRHSILKIYWKKTESGWREIRVDVEIVTSDSA